MKLKIIFAPLLLSTIMDYTVMNAMTHPTLLPSAPSYVGQTLQQKQEIFAYNSALLIIHIFETGYKCTLGEAFRTHEQAVIYMHDSLGIVHSKHCDRLALDLNLFDSQGRYIHTDNKEYEQLGNYWHSLNPYNRWGGTFKRGDFDHFEMD